MAPLGERVRFAGVAAACRAAGRLCRRRPLPLARDQRSLWHGLSRSPGGGPARRRRPHRRRARGGGRRRHRPADADRRSRAAFAAAVGRLLDDARRARAAGRRRRERASSPGTTSARRPMRWPPPWRGCDERAVRRPAPRAHRLERRAAACRASTDTPLSAAGEAAARRWRLPAPADRWRRLVQPAAARPAHRRADAAFGAGHGQFARCAR